MGWVAPSRVRMTRMDHLLPIRVSTLRTGWTWISYVPQVVLSVQDALAGLTPNENDVIKSHSDFAIYSHNKWIGTLENMMPGKSYIYYNKGGNKSFTYPSRRVSSPTSAKAMISDPAWSVDCHRWADNLTLVATLYIEDWEAIPGTYSVGAFCGDECRGVAQVVDERLFITVHGSPGDVISFKAMESLSGEVSTAEEMIEFSEAHYGNLEEPYELHIIKQGSGLADALVEKSYNIYPNPVRDRLYVNGDIQKVSRVKVININGQLIIDSPYNDGIDVTHLDTGTYIACIVTTEGIVYKKFIKA